MRMEESNPTKKVLFTIPLRNRDRRRGSSKLRWHEMLEEDVTWVGFRNRDRRRGSSKLRWREMLEEDVTWVGFRNWRINTVLCFRPNACDLKHISAIMLKILGGTIQCSVAWVLG